MNCNIMPERKLQTAALRPRLQVTLIDTYSLPVYFYWFFSLQDFVSTTYTVFSVAFLTSLEASSEPFFSSLNEVAQPDHIRAAPPVLTPKPCHLPPWLLGQELTAGPERVAGWIWIWHPQEYSSLFFMAGNLSFPFLVLKNTRTPLFWCSLLGFCN